MPNFPFTFLLIIYFLSFFMLKSRGTYAQFSLYLFANNLFFLSFFMLKSGRTYAQISIYFFANNLFFSKTINFNRLGQLTRMQE